MFGWVRRRRGKHRIVIIGARPLATFVAPVPPPAGEPVPPPEPAPTQAVQLGFADGSTVDLDPDDPRAASLRAAAEALLQGTPGGAPPSA